ncbi:ATP/GTP-binding protein [Streptomyces lydicus]|uniref:ATP/GTP-binding protein n=1 Tax=Streptomyces lydicus TaxID=47763 RepID=UPI00343A49A3
MDDHKGRTATPLLLTRGLTIAIASVLALSLPGAAAMADDGDAAVGDCAGNQSYICVDAKDPGTEGTSGSRPSGGGGKAKGKKHSAVKCSVKKLDPQPPAENLGWEGHKPGDGAVYVRTCAGPGATGQSSGVFWSKQAPAAKAVDPAVLAREAVDKMRLTGPDIGILPKPGGKGLVALPVWMWTAKTAEAYGPNTATASAGAVTVTATAKVDQIVWDMGDGQSVTCTTAGTPYKASYGKRRSPDCGYLYQRSSKDEPGQEYHVTATSTWTVNWNGSGQSGQLTETRQSQTQVAIGQLKVLN